jgi:two-component system chemotaxis sensor kinase CheA
MSKNLEYSVLIVDDENEILEVFQEYIQEAGFKVHKSTGAKEAIALLNEYEPEIVCIISDFKMPELTGFDFRKQILQKFKHIPFIICSSHISREDALKAVELKISSFIQKPVKKEEFVQVIQEQSKDRITQLVDDRELKIGFVNEAENLLEELESLLVDLDKNQDQETLNRIFAIAHTIKGSSGFFKEDIINKFTHKYEDFFAPYNKKVKTISQNVIDVLLKGADVIKVLVKALKENKIHKHQLESYLPILNINLTEDSSVNTPPPTNDTQQTTNQNLTKAREDIKVSLDLLDEFSELSGEITVIRNMVNKAVKNIEKEFTGNKNVSVLSELLSEMHKINGSLQEKVVEIRKSPIKNILKPLQRTVRDLSNTLKKKIVFNIINDDLRVDTTISEVLSNSLIHMIRNSVDHGIELPEDRKKSGKNEQGTITVSAKELSEEILIQISDDGKGLNADFLRKKIVEKKLRTNEQALKMSDKEVWGMIFESGFSTAQVVTDISGRGVGMDMVKKSILKIGGRIDIDSKVGSGTTFSIFLPIPKSVTIIGSVLVECNKETYAIPQDSIVRLLKYQNDDDHIQLKHLHGADCLIIDEEIFPIIDLNMAFSVLPEQFENAKKFNHKEGNFVIARAEHIKYAIYVDQIIDQEDTVVKKFGNHLKHINQFLGATFSGDGNVSLIIDTQGLATMFNLHEHLEAQKNMQMAENANNNSSATNGVIPSHLLLFQLESPGHFGIPLEQVYRLEKFSASTIQMSGSQKVVLYRDTIVPIFNLEALVNNLSDNNNFDNLSHGEISVIMIEEKDRFKGYYVRSIEDLVSTHNAVDESFAHGEYLVGASIIENKTVSIIYLKNLSKKDSEQKPHDKDSASLAA